MCAWILAIDFNCFIFQAEEYIDSFEFDLAQKFCLRALESEPDNLRAIETYGNLLMETGDLDKAKQVSFTHKSGFDFLRGIRL